MILELLGMFQTNIAVHVVFSLKGLIEKYHVLQMIDTCLIE